MFDGIRKLFGTPEEERNALEPKPEQAGKMPIGMQILTDDTFTHTIGRYPTVVVDFWAPWCAPCKIVSPVVASIARDMAGKAVFGKLNVAQNKAVPSQLKIKGIPTIMVFSHGKQVERIVGAAPRATLDSKIRKHIGN